MQIKVVRSLGRPVLWLCGFAQCWVRKFWMLTFSKNASYHRWLFEGVHLEVVTSQNVVLKQQLLQIKHSTWEYDFSMTACVMVLSVFVLPLSCIEYAGLSFQNGGLVPACFWQIWLASSAELRSWRRLRRRSRRWLERSQLASFPGSFCRAMRCSMNCTLRTALWLLVGCSEKRSVHSSLVLDILPCIVPVLSDTLCWCVLGNTFLAQAFHKLKQFPIVIWLSQVKCAWCVDEQSVHFFHFLN